MSVKKKGKKKSHNKDTTNKRTKRLRKKLFFYDPGVEKGGVEKEDGGVGKEDGRVGEKDASMAQAGQKIDESTDDKIGIDDLTFCCSGIYCQTPWISTVSSKCVMCSKLMHNTCFALISDLTKKNMLFL